MENTPRFRIHRMNPRVGSASKSTSSQEDQLGKLQPKIPPNLLKPMATKKDPTLRPLQINSQGNNRESVQTQSNKLAPIANVIKKKDPVKYGRPGKTVYKLVEDAKVPSKIKDIRHRRIFLKLDHLGHGSFARVYKVLDQQINRHFAAKIISKSSLETEQMKKKLLAEINIHRVLNHDYIVKFYTCFEDNENVYLILELCANKSLSVMIKSRGFLTEPEVRFYMGQILSALRYMSDNRVLHRDLKLGNVLIDSNMDCKLGDFGLAALLVDNKDRKNTVCGTPHYIAPEIIFKQGHSTKADMWSAGILMFNLLFGKHPFPQNVQHELYEQLRKNELGTQYNFPPSKDYDVSDDAKDLITKLLVNDPDERLSVIDALEHPFFSCHDMPDCIPKKALFVQPSYAELFKGKCSDSQVSKVATAIQAAKSRTENFVDNNINPPLELINEVVLDPRSQYPIEVKSSQPSNPLVIPIESDAKSTSRKRSDVVQDRSSKRICNNSDIETNPSLQKEDITDKVEQPEVKTSNVTSSSSTDSRPFAIPLPPPNRKPIMEEMADNLKIMMERVSAIPNSRRTPTLEEIKDFQWHEGNVYVQNWVDGSPQYGFSYRLSDGTLGLLFNDGTTLTTKDENKYSFIYRDENDICINKTYENGVPPELEKKCLVLKKFMQYISQSQPFNVVANQTTELSTTHIFKYLISQEGIIFRLNNGVIQFNLFRRVKIVLYDRGRKLIFIDTDKLLHHYNSWDVLNSTETEIIEVIHAVYAILVNQNKARQEALRQLRWTRIEQSYKHPTIPPP